MYTRDVDDRADKIAAQINRKIEQDNRMGKVTSSEELAKTMRSAFRNKEDNGKLSLRESWGIGFRKMPRTIAAYVILGILYVFTSGRIAYTLIMLTMSGFFFWTFIHSEKTISAYRRGVYRGSFTAELILNGWTKIKNIVLGKLGL